MSEIKPKTKRYQILQLKIIIQGLHEIINTQSGIINSLTDLKKQSDDIFKTL